MVDDLGSSEAIESGGLLALWTGIISVLSRQHLRLAKRDGDLGEGLAFSV